MKNSIKLPDGRTAMNLFELMDAIEVIDKRVKDVEKQSHEPQNYKEKCDKMEKRIENLEKKLKIKYDDRTEKEKIEDWKKEMQERKEMIEQSEHGNDEYEVRSIEQQQIETNTYGDDDWATPPKELDRDTNETNN